jgi:hypothetical protein
MHDNHCDRLGGYFIIVFYQNVMQHTSKQIHREKHPPNDWLADVNSGVDLFVQNNSRC